MSEPPHHKDEGGLPGKGSFLQESPNGVLTRWHNCPSARKAAGNGSAPGCKARAVLAGNSFKPVSGPTALLLHMVYGQFLSPHSVPAMVPGGARCGSTTIPWCQVKARGHSTQPFWALHAHPCTATVTGPRSTLCWRVEQGLEGWRGVPGSASACHLMTHPLVLPSPTRFDHVPICMDSSLATNRHISRKGSHLVPVSPTPHLQVTYLQFLV